MFLSIHYETEGVIDNPNQPYIMRMRIFFQEIEWIRFRSILIISPNESYTFHLFLHKYA